MNAHLREDYFFVSLLWGGGADCMKWTDLKTVQFYPERWDFLRSVLSTSRCSVHFLIFLCIDFCTVTTMSVI